MSLGVKGSSSSEVVIAHRSERMKFVERERSDPHLSNDELPTSHFGAVTIETLTNHGGNVSWTPRWAFRPDASIEALTAVIRHIRTSLPPGTHIKFGGSRHSWSDVAATPDAYIHPERIKGISSLPLQGATGDDLRETVSAESRGQLIRVLAGTTIREINHALWNLGLGLPVLGGFDGQTIAGVFPTGTHGSVLSRGPLCELVHSLDVVLANGMPCRIEPSAGITDPIRFRQLHPEMKLEQDDEMFVASLVHLGAMFAVHSLVLEVRNKFYLKEVRSPIALGALKSALKNGGIYRLANANPNLEQPVTDVAVDNPVPLEFQPHPQPAFHLEFLLNPYRETVIVTSRHPTTVETEPPTFAGSPQRDLFRALSLEARFVRPAFLVWLQETFPTAIGWMIDKLTRLVPRITPWLIDQSLNSLPDPAYIQRSYNVFNIGDGANMIPALSATAFVPLQNDAYLEAIDVLQATARIFAERGIYHTGPIALRFVRGSRALLAPPEDVGAFELIFGGHPERAEEMVRAYHDALRARFGTRFWMHWGQMHQGLTADQVTSSYVQLAAWKRIRQQFDPDGIFLNASQARLFEFGHK